MQTVNFRCGHCNNLMAVSTEYLGQQVRCPHCQQVVIAPTSAPLPAPAPDLGATENMFAPPPTAADHEDIFTQTEDADDLFGRSSAPRLELPPEPAPAPAAGDNTQPLPPPEPAASTLTWAPPGAAPEPPADAPTVTASAEAAPWLSGPTFTETAAPPPAAAGETTLPESAPAAVGLQEAPADGLAAIPQPARRGAQGGAWFMPLVFIPLCFYAIMATIAVAILYTRQQTQQQPSPFEKLPDIDGDSPGVRAEGDPPDTRRPRVAGLHYPYDERLSDAPLPAKLRTRLNQTITLGDLEVTPLKVERKVVKVYVEGSAQAEPCRSESLVLHLRLRNTSGAWWFTPLDNYFDRRWSPKRGSGPPPMTQLVIGSRRYYGGPAAWCPRQRRRDDTRRREWVQGPGRVDYDSLGLAPGQEMTSIVCTDGGTADDPDRDDELPHVLDGTNTRGARVREPYHGKLLWRVHVRRGVVLDHGKRYPATAVLGVEFTDTDIQRPRQAG